MTSNERVLWEGAPPQGFRLAPQDLFMIPFSIVWTGAVLSICFLVVAGQATEVDPIAYVVLPFMAVIGLHMLAGRFLVDIAARRRTRYTLTDRRAIIEGGLFQTGQRSVSLAAAPEIRLRRERNGRGTIQFGSSMFSMVPSSWPGAGQFLPPMFESIADAQRVYDLAIKTQSEAQTRP